MRVCPRCNQPYSCSKHDVDFVHNCNSELNALDNEDLPRVDTPNWNMQGFGTKVLGQNVNTMNVWGHNESTHKERKHEEFIDLR